jgi:hypothetical protein
MDDRGFPKAVVLEWWIAAAITAALTAVTIRALDKWVFPPKGKTIIVEQCIERHFDASGMLIGSLPCRSRESDICYGPDAKEVSCRRKFNPSTGDVY